jgi:hypothetical protein
MYESVRSKGKISGHVSQYYMNNASQRACIIPIIEDEKYSKDEMNRPILHFPQGVPFCKDPQTDILRENTNFRNYFEKLDTKDISGVPYTSDKKNYILADPKDFVEPRAVMEVRELFEPPLPKKDIKLNHTVIMRTEEDVIVSENTEETPVMKSKIENTEIEVLRAQQERNMMDVEERRSDPNQLEQV